MKPVDRILFLGGTFSIKLYTKVQGIKNYKVINNEFEISIYHNTTPIFVMEDSSDIYGESKLHQILAYGERGGYVFIPLTYTEPFPTDDEIALFIESAANKDS